MVPATRTYIGRVDKDDLAAEVRKWLFHYGVTSTHTAVRTIIPPVGDNGDRSRMLSARTQSAKNDFASIPHSSLPHLPLILPHCLRDRVDHIAGEGAAAAELFAREFASAAVQMDGGAGGVEAIHLL